MIENIDMLVNLKELDLSFNYIERIQNLDKLTKLEVLSLFNNKIELIENIDTLENLVILSIGNNEINTLQGVSWWICLNYLIYPPLLLFSCPFLITPSNPIFRHVFAQLQFSLSHLLQSSPQMKLLILISLNR